MDSTKIFSKSPEIDKDSADLFCTFLQKIILNFLSLFSKFGSNLPEDSNYGNSLAWPLSIDDPKMLFRYSRVNNKKRNHPRPCVAVKKYLYGKIFFGNYRQIIEPVEKMIQKRFFSGQISYPISIGADETWGRSTLRKLDATVK